MKAASPWPSQRPAAAASLAAALGCAALTCISMTLLLWQRRTAGNARKPNGPKAVSLDRSSPARRVALLTSCPRPRRQASSGPPSDRPSPEPCAPPWSSRPPADTSRSAPNEDVGFRKSFDHAPAAQRGPCSLRPENTPGK